MSTYQIFSHDVLVGLSNKGTTKNFSVWVSEGTLQYVIDGEIRHDIDSVSDFLIAAAKVINKGDDDNSGNLSTSGANINPNGLENYENGAVTHFDKVNPSVNYADADTAVTVGGAGVGGTFRADFGTGTNALAEAALFKGFADDLLGKSSFTQIDSFSGNLAGFTRTVITTQRDDDVKKVSYKPSGEKNATEWADAYIDSLGESFGLEKISDGKVSETGYTANQLNINEVKGWVSLGSQGVGGSEKWAYDDLADAQAFFDAVKDAFDGGDRRAIINSVIEDLAEDLGGSQLKNGNVSTGYQAKQIKLMGEDGDMVTLGSHGVGGKETYEFADKATAMQFIDEVRDLVGVVGHAKQTVDEFVFTVSGAGVSGKPKFVGKDAFVEWLGDEFDGTQTRDGAVSEGFNGNVRESADGLTVTLGPSGVGGKEVWTFDNEADADGFIAALDEFF